ncbi:DUF4145 domain-containing protein [Rhizobium leguminosarum]
MGSIIKRDCVRCGTRSVQLSAIGYSHHGDGKWEIAFACNNCSQISIYRVTSGMNLPQNNNLNFDARNGVFCEQEAILNVAKAPILDPAIPGNIAAIFDQAAKCRRLEMPDAAGAMFRKTIDISTKAVFAIDPRLADKKPAEALRVRIKALGQFKVLEEDIVELADVVAVDGNDAAHDVDPYTPEEAEALEELTVDLLDRIFVRPARIAAVRAKQIVAGQRKE